MSAARLTRCGIMFMITISFDHNPATWPSCTTNANTKNINIKTRAAPHVHQPAASPAHAVCRYHPLILLYLHSLDIYIQKIINEIIKVKSLIASRTSYAKNYIKGTHLCLFVIPHSTFKDISQNSGPIQAQVEKDRTVDR